MSTEMPLSVNVERDKAKNGIYIQRHKWVHIQGVRTKQARA